MANEIIVPYSVTGRTVYAILRNSVGQVWQTTTLTFVTYVTANRANYDITLTEQGTSSQTYVGDIPILDTGVYSVVAYDKETGAFLESDPFIAAGEIEWDGASVSSLGTIHRDITDIQADTDDIQSRLPAALVGGRIDANIGAISGDSNAADNLESATDGTGYNLGNGLIVSLPDAAGVRTAIGLGSANLDTQLTTKPTLAQILEGGDIDGYSLEETLKLCLAALAGKLSGAATTTIVIRAADDSKNRITATVDSSGNRTAITIDETG